MRLPRAKRGRTLPECWESVPAAVRRTRCGSTTPRICCRSSASLTAAGSIRARSSPRWRPARRRSRPRRHRCRRRDPPTRKTRSRPRAAVAPRWTATVLIRARVPVIRPGRPEVPAAAVRPIIRQTRPVDHPSPVDLRRPASSPRRQSASSGHRRSKAERNLLIQVRHHRPPEITLR